MTIEEAYEHIGAAILKLLPENWKQATLEIERQEKSVDYSGDYILDNGEEEYLDIWEFEIEDDIIHLIYKIMTNGDKNSPNRWNKANFTIHPDKSFNTEFIWDQELQDEIEKLNNE